MEKYSWQEKVNIIGWGNNGIISFLLEIGDEKPGRYLEEGVLQVVKLSYLFSYPNNTYEGDVIFETTFGREYAMNYFENFNYDGLSLENKNNFKNWLITSLTPITEQRKIKINRIKTKII